MLVPKGFSLNNLETLIEEQHDESGLDTLSASLEAVLFACGSPVSTERLCEVLNISAAELDAARRMLEVKYRQANSGIALVFIDGALQLCTKREYATQVKSALELKKLPPLSKAALEVLAIIAYNQPVTRVFIEQVRGIESSQIVSSLCDKGLVKEDGILDAPGRPLLFSTTDAFLRCFGLSSLSDLPYSKLDDVSSEKDSDAVDQLSLETE